MVESRGVIVVDGKVQVRGDDIACFARFAQKHAGLNIVAGFEMVEGGQVAIAEDQVVGAVIDVEIVVHAAIAAIVAALGAARVDSGDDTAGYSVDIGAIGDIKVYGMAVIGCDLRQPSMGGHLEEWSKVGELFHFQRKFKLHPVAE